VALMVLVPLAFYAGRHERLVLLDRDLDRWVSKVLAVALSFGLLVAAVQRRRPHPDLLPAGYSTAGGRGGPRGRV
jgi:hypothetical protein